MNGLLGYFYITILMQYDKDKIPIRELKGFRVIITDG